MKTTIETVDHVDMAEYAAETGERLGTIPLEFVSVFDEEFDQHGHAAYVESDFIGQGGWYNSIEKALAAIAYCVGNQSAGLLSEFVLPAHGETTQFLVVTIDTRE